MNGANVWYKEPVNTTEGQNYIYIYHYQDEDHYMPDGVVFFIMFILCVNVIVAIPSNIFVLISIILDKNLHNCKFAFITMIVISDLINGCIICPIAIRAISVGKILKSKCYNAAAVETASFSLSTLSLGFLALKTVIKMRSKDDLEKQNQFRLVVTRTSIGFIIVIEVCLFILAVVGAGPLNPGWQPYLLRCSVDFDSFHAIWSGAVKSTAFQQMFTVVLFLAIMVANGPLTVGTTIYFTYKKVRNYLNKKSKETRSTTQQPNGLHKGDDLFSGTRGIKIADILSQSRGEQAFEDPNQTRTESKASNNEYDQEEQVDLDLYLMLVLSVTVLEPNFLISLLSLKNAPLQATTYNLGFLLASINPIILICFEPTLRHRFEQSFDSFKCNRNTKISAADIGSSGAVTGLTLPLQHRLRMNSIETKDYLTMLQTRIGSSQATAAVIGSETVRQSAANISRYIAHDKLKSDREQVGGVVSSVYAILATLRKQDQDKKSHQITGELTENVLPASTTHMTSIPKKTPRSLASIKFML